MAQARGFEPLTPRLTAECTTYCAMLEYNGSFLWICQSTSITTQSNIFWFTGAVVCHYALSSIHFLGILMNMAPFFPFEFIRVKLKPSIQGSFSHWGTSQKLFDLIGGLPDAAKQ